MKTLELKSREYSQKMGQICADLKPNITEDSLFIVDGKPLGFYLQRTPDKLFKLLDIGFSINIWHFSSAHLIATSTCLLVTLHIREMLGFSFKASVRS